MAPGARSLRLAAAIFTAVPLGSTPSATVPATETTTLVENFLPPLAGPRLAGAVRLLRVGSGIGHDESRAGAQANELLHGLVLSQALTRDRLARLLRSVERNCLLADESPDRAAVVMGNSDAVDDGAHSNAAVAAYNHISEFLGKNNQGAAAAAANRDNDAHREDKLHIFRTDAATAGGALATASEQQESEEQLTEQQRELVAAERRALLDGENSYGFSPLHVAVALGNEEILAILLEAGADTEVWFCNQIGADVPFCIQGNMASLSILVAVGYFSLPLTISVSRCRC
eukprot:gene185-180_t